MKEEVSSIRVNIDEVAQLAELIANEKGYTNIGPYYEISKQLRLAKAWGGYLMNEFGDPSPYQNNGKRHSVADIEPTNGVAVIGNLTQANFLAKNLVEQIDYMREVIQATAGIVDGLSLPNDTTRKANISRTQIYVRLMEAKILLGLELGRLRDGK